MTNITRLLLLSNLFGLLTNGLFAQNITIQGKIKDSESKELLIGATVYIPTLQKGTSADANGNYVLELAAADTLTLLFSYVGYATSRKTISANKNQTLNITLASQATLQEVVVTEQKSYKEQIQSTQMSVTSIDMREAKLLPALFGEVDILKTLQLKPGVKSGGEGTSGIYVRGGGADQNLMLLDDAPVYNASHLFGFFSVFNSDAVKGLDLYKGGFPSQYGGRLSSVVDVKLRDGNQEKYSVTGGIGLISSRILAEGPIQKNKSAFIVSARRTYFDTFTRRYNDSQKNKPDYQPIPDYYFYDLNAKLNYELSDKDRLFFSAYYGRDVFHYNQNRFTVNFDWGNTASSLRWNHVFSPHLFANTSVVYAAYNYGIHNDFSGFKFGLGSGIKDYTLKTNFNYTGYEKHNIQFGAEATHHIFDIGRASGASSDGEFSFSVGERLTAREYGLYISDDYTFNPRWQLNGGLRLSGMERSGEYMGGLEPRLSVRYMLNENSSLKFGYSRMYQYLNLVSSSGSSLPTDLWYPSGGRTRPQNADQLAASYSTTFLDGKLLFTNEVYYKKMRNQVDFKDGSNLFINGQLDTTFVFGKGSAYGTEFYLEKKNGRLTGWIGYTLAWAWRQFDEISQGQKFHPRYDRRHDISVVVMYQISKRLSLSASWVYNTGNAITLPKGRYYYQDINGTTNPTPGIQLVPDYGALRNTFRMPAYHRMDVGLVLKTHPRWGEADWTFSIYNLYSRMNPYFIYFETVTENPDGTGQIKGIQAKQVSLFPIIPSVTYNFRF